MSLTALQATALKAATSGEVDKATSLTPGESTTLKAAFNVYIDMVPPPPLLVWRLPLNLADLTCLQRQFQRDRYNRFQSALIFTATTISEKFEGIDQRPGEGAAKPLHYAKYTLEIDGVERAVAVPPWLSPSIGLLKGAFGTEPDGLYLSELFGWDAAGAKTLLMRCGIYLDRLGLCKDADYTWRHSGSHSWIKGNPSNDVVLMAKDAAVPVPRPLPERKSFVAFSTAVAATKIARRMLVPGAFEGDHDQHYPCVTQSGITVCENTQGYVASALFAKHSQLPIIMGPRNVCRLPYPLSARTRRSGQTLVCGNGYIAQLDSTGAAKLMAGHCHKEAIYWKEPPTSVLDPRYIRRGKWDPAIAVEEQIFWEPWGGGWVPQSLVIDMNAPLIDGEHPHLSYTTADGRFVNGPLWVQTDRRGGVVGVQFDGHDFDAEPFIYWFLPPGTLSDGWGLATHGNSLYITERVGQRISEWNLDTRQKIGDVVSAPLAFGVGYVRAAPTRRFTFNPDKTVTDARLFPICFPEGLDKFIDAAGDVWLYFTSSAMQQANRINLRTNKFETGVAVLPARMYARGGVGDYFTTIAVSPIVEGFGPPGTMFFSTFFNEGYGKSVAILPGGTGWAYFNYWGGSSNYPITQCVGGNRLTTLDADGWIDQFHFMEGVDKLVSTQYLPGLVDWIASGCSVKYGPNAVGSGSTPYVFGEPGHADRDVYARDFLGLS